MPDIALHNISKSFKTYAGRKTVLDNVSLTFPAGTSIGILGRNGQGKTTLLRIIGGHVYPDSGHVVRNASISWPIGYGSALHSQLTGRENIRFLSRIYNVPFSMIYGFVDSFIDLGEYIDMPVKTYSSGMRSKLAFSMSMALEFDFYLVDEATSAGDMFFRERCKEEFQKRKERSTLIMVSHNITTIQDHCDTAYVLHNGEIVKFSDMDEAIVYYKRHTGKTT